MDNIYVTNKETTMKMYKVTKTTQWNCKGNMRNYIKYMKANSIEEVIKHFGTENILEVEEFTN